MLAYSNKADSDSDSDRGSDRDRPSLLFWPVCVFARDALAVACQKTGLLFLSSRKKPTGQGETDCFAYTYVQYSHCVIAVSETTVLGESLSTAAALTGLGLGCHCECDCEFVKH